MPNHRAAIGDGGSFHVFSIRPKITNARSSCDSSSLSPSEPSSSTSRQYITRKTHKKSRLGCHACKARRVKCDEQRPVCGRCHKTKATCDYSGRPSTSKQTPTANKQLQKDSKLPLARSHAAPSSSSQQLTVQVPRPIEKLTREAFLLKHYDAVTGAEKDTITCSDTLVGNQSHEYRMCILRLAHQHSYLMHAVLATAALHLTFHNVDGYRLVKLSHLQMALSEFQKAIRKPIVQGEVDAILLCSMMINMQHFAWIESVLPQDSWVFSAEPSRLDWLSVQLGLLHLIMSTRQFHAESLLAPVWKSSAYDVGGVEGLSPALTKICGVSDNMSDAEKESNTYHIALQYLAPLFRMERSSASIVQYIRFIRALPRSFFELAQCNDERALLILSYWFGLMCHVDFWWVERRAKRDCTALCMYLDANAGHEVRDLLDFPAQACGYTIRSSRGYVVEEDPTLAFLNVYD